MDWKYEIEEAKKLTDCGYELKCLEAVEELMEVFSKQEHSGFSASAVLSIFQRLAKHMPLSEITEEDFKRSEEDRRIGNSPEWLTENNLKDEIQCLRYSALFKNIHLDDTVTYSDIDRVVCIDQRGLSYTCGIEREIIDEMYPITLPYYPTLNKYEVYVDEYLLDENNGDFDTKHIKYVILPHKEKVNIDRWFTEHNHKMGEVTDAIELVEIMKKVLAQKQAEKN